VTGMVDESSESNAARSSIWTRLIFSVGRIRDETADPSTLSAVERQTENSRKGGTIWEALRKADAAAMKDLVTIDGENVNARGPVGECPVHMLFLYGTETHLSMARYLIINFPHTITQIYNQSVYLNTMNNVFLLKILYLTTSRSIMVKMYFTLLLLNEMQPWLNGFSVKNIINLINSNY
jgi:hypothetical protein